MLVERKRNLVARFCSEFVSISKTNMYISLENEAGHVQMMMVINPNLISFFVISFLQIYKYKHMIVDFKCTVNCRIIDQTFLSVGMD